MQFPQLVKGTLLKRYKRFLADVELASGEVVTAHCPNTGAMTGCAEPGWQVWLSQSTNPKRKLAYTWELVKTNQDNFIGVNTHRANALVKEALAEAIIDPLAGYQLIKSEVRFGQENSRIDFLLSDQNRSDCYVEVKSVTLADNTKGFFPDAKTLRGQKHLRELNLLAQQGKRAVLLFCVQHTGIDSVSIAQHIDPDYTQALNEARCNGVEVLCYTCHIEPEKIYIDHPLPFISEQ